MDKREVMMKSQREGGGGKAVQTLPTPANYKFCKYIEHFLGGPDVCLSGLWCRMRRGRGLVGLVGWRRLLLLLRLKGFDMR